MNETVRELSNSHPMLSVIARRSKRCEVVPQKTSQSQSLAGDLHPTLLQYHWGLNLNYNSDTSLASCQVTKRRKKYAGLSLENGEGTNSGRIHLDFLVSPVFILSLEMITPAKLSSLRISTSPKAVAGVRAPAPPAFGYGRSSKFNTIASAASLESPEQS